MEVAEVEVTLRGKDAQLKQDLKNAVKEAEQSGEKIKVHLWAKVPEFARAQARQMMQQANTEAKKNPVKIPVEVNEKDAAKARAKANKLAEDLGKDIGAGIRRGMDRAGNALTLGVTIPAIAGIRSAIKAASDLTEAQNKMNVVFGKSSDIVGKFANDSAVAYNISMRAANEYAANFGNIIKSTKLSGAAIAEMSVKLTKLGGDMSSFNNIPVADALQKLRAGLVGEAEPLRVVGVQLTEAAVAAKAAAMGFKGKNKELTEGQKILARYALIMEQTTNQQGDAIRTGNEVAGTEKRLAAEVENLAAKFGKDLLPVYKDGLHVAGDLLKAFNALSPAQREQYLKWGLMFAAAGPVLKVMSGLFSITSSIVSISAAYVKAQDAMAAADARRAAAQGGVGVAGGAGTASSLLSRLVPTGLLGTAAVAGGTIYGIKLALEKAWQLDAVQDSKKRMDALQDVIPRMMSEGVEKGKSKAQLRSEYMARERVTKGPGFDKDFAAKNFEMYYREGYADAVKRMKASALKDLGTKAPNLQSEFDKLMRGGVGDTAKGKTAVIKPDNQQWKEIVRSIMSEVGGLRVTSENRPGAVTRGTGRPSLHSVNQALDISGTPERMAALFNAIRQLVGDSNIRELIYSPLGIVKNGKFSKTIKNDKTRADHYNHVHASLRPGAYGGDISDALGDPKFKEAMSLLQGRETMLKTLGDQTEEFRRKIQFWGKDTGMAAQEFDLLNTKLGDTNLRLKDILATDPKMRQAVEENLAQMRKLAALEMQSNVLAGFAEAGKAWQERHAEEAAANAEWAATFAASMREEVKTYSKLEELQKELQNRNIPRFIRKGLESQARAYDNAERGGAMADEISGGIMNLRDLATQMAAWGKGRQELVDGFQQNLGRELTSRWGNAGDQTQMWKSDQLAKYRADMEQYGMTVDDIASRLRIADVALNDFLKKDESFAKMREQMDSLGQIMDNRFGNFLDSMLTDGRHFTSHLTNLFGGMVDDIGKEFLRLQFIAVRNWALRQLFGAATKFATGGGGISSGGGLSDAAGSGGVTDVAGAAPSTAAPAVHQSFVFNGPADAGQVRQAAFQGASAGVDVVIRTARRR